MKPMLAKRFTPDRITYPCYIQRKLDGVRALSIPGQLTLQSRPKPPDFKKIFWHPDTLRHIDNDLTLVRAKFPTLILDGELYNHALSLQQINSRVAVKRTSPHKDVLSISYIIFDVFDPAEPLAPASVRCQTLNRMIQSLRSSGLQYIRIMPMVFCPTPAHGDRYHALALSNRHEGTIYRNDEPYTTHLVCNNKENRTWAMQKRKPTLDIQTTIVGMEESSKRPGLLKCFHVRDTTGTVFSVGTGYSLVDRKRYWALGQSCLGGTVRVTFRLRSDSGQPLEPRAELVELPNK